jgi:hypothetical protein
LTTEAKDAEAIAKLSSDLAYLLDERKVEGFCRKASVYHRERVRSERALHGFLDATGLVFSLKHPRHSGRSK